MPPRKPKTLPAPARPTPPETAAKALAAVAERLRLLAPTDILPVNTDVPRAVSIALGAAPRIAELRPGVVHHLQRFDLAHIDELPTLAMAAWYAHLQWVASTSEMADQVMRISETLDGRAMVVWAHNGHVMRYSEVLAPGVVYHSLGSHLDRRLGEAYAPIGLVFDEGSFRAIDANHGGAPKTWKVGASREGSISHVLARQGMDAAYIDLDRPENVAALGDRPIAYRQIEAVFDPAKEQDAYAEMVLPEHFDGLLFVRVTSPTTPLSAGL